MGLCTTRESVRAKASERKTKAMSGHRKPATTLPTDAVRVVVLAVLVAHGYQHREVHQLQNCEMHLVAAIQDAISLHSQKFVLVRSNKELDKLAPKPFDTAHD